VAVFVLLLQQLLGRMPAVVAQSQNAACAAERADVRTLADPSASAIDETQIIGAHISTLAAFPLPESLPEKSRFDPYETTVYRTAGDLVSAKLGSNQEIDVVIADPDGKQTITIVFPDTARCAQGADPDALKLMQQARQQFITTLGVPPSGAYTQLTGQAVVTGIGFIDASVAANGGSGIQLAPVLDIEFAQAAVIGPPAAAGPNSASMQPPSAAGPALAARIFYVDTAPFSASIYCDTDPALRRANPRTLRPFRSLDLALAAYPGFHLARPC